MLLKSFHVQKYRNVLDSTEVAAQKDVTCLVGMNESGKTAMIDALYRLNPVYDDRFLERDDYPRWRWKRDGRSEDLSKISPIGAVFELTEDDKALVRGKFGDQVLLSSNIQVGRDYGDRLWTKVEVDELRAVGNLLNEHGFPMLVHENHTFAELIQSLTEREPSASDERDEQRAELLREARQRLDGGNDTAEAVRGLLTVRLPRFSASTPIRTSKAVSMQTLRSGQDEEPGASPKQTARALLRLADTDIDAITDEEFESRTAELEAVSSDLSRELSEYWSQNPELRIKIDVVQETVPANRPYGGQTTVVRYLDFRVEDRKHDFTNNFGLRSSGYQWFFSSWRRLASSRARRGRSSFSSTSPG